MAFDQCEGNEARLSLTTRCCDPTMRKRHCEATDTGLCNTRSSGDPTCRVMTLMWRDCCAAMVEAGCDRCLMMLRMPD